MKYLPYALLGVSLCLGYPPSAQTPINGYPPISGKKTGQPNPLSPDPIFNYTWVHPKASDDLESYTLRPHRWVASNPKSFDMSDFTATDVVAIKGKGNIRFDFGQTNAGWLEFESEDLADSITMSISEYNEPAIVNEGAVHRFKTLTPVKHGHMYRLELNPELYEGVRFGWISVLKHEQTWHMKHFRVVCQTKPVNYQGNFSCSDRELTRIWYTGAYTVKLNLLKDYFGAILMERTDRFSWTGDAYVAQAASMVAFGNYDFVKANLEYTARQDNGIASYALYWVLSLIDYVNYTGDTAFAKKYLDNACQKLDRAYEHFGKSPKLEFFGWDERLGAGFENANIVESQRAYSMVSIRAWKEYGKLMEQMGQLELAGKYTGYAVEKMAEERTGNNWADRYGVHAAADAINTGLTTGLENELFYAADFTDRVDRLSYSPFNEYFIIGAMAKMQKYADAVSAIKDCWGGQLRYGGTTFFEVYRPSWNAILGKNDPVINNQCGYTSLTHPWSAGVTKWLSEEMLGIKPLEPGFTSFTIIPHLTDTISAVSGSTPTLHGAISASFNVRTGQAIIAIPPGTRAERVAIPIGENRVKAVYLNGKLTAGSVGDGYITIMGLGPGKYEYKVIYDGYHQGKRATPLPWKYVISDCRQDSLTIGKWKGRYGQDGFVLFSYFAEKKDWQQLPAYVSAVVPRNEAPVHPELAGDSFGAITTQDPKPVLQTMTIDVKVSGDQPHRLAIYFLDWDQQKRRSAVEIFDAETLRLLAPVKLIKDYKNGKYLIFTYSKSIRIRVNQVRGPNAAVSGLFFDPL